MDKQAMLNEVFESAVMDEFEKIAKPAGRVVKRMAKRIDVKTPFKAIRGGERWGSPRNLDEVAEMVAKTKSPTTAAILVRGAEKYKRLPLSVRSVPMAKIRGGRMMKSAPKTMFREMREAGGEYGVNITKNLPMPSAYR